ncbi:MAG: lycopene cyclase family protein [Myxococcota bacterium]
MHAVVIGSGPAGWIAGGACVAEGWSATIVSPEFGAFAPTYCAWLDDLPQDWRSEVACTWSEVDVYSERGQHTLSRPYVWIDGKAVRARLEREASGVRLHQAKVSSLEAVDGAVQVVTEDGVLAADLVIDCAGRVGGFAQVEAHRSPAALQTAYGEFLHAPHARLERPVLMDFRGMDGPHRHPPTFGYVLPLPNRTVLVEETVLAARPAVPVEELRGLQLRRKEAYGLSDCEVKEVERVRIAMGGPRAGLRGFASAFGAAGGMVHPATGYLFATLLRVRPRLRLGLRRALRASKVERRVEGMGRALWPGTAGLTRGLQVAGLELVLRMDQARVAGFFDAFFRSPERSWSAYMRGDPSLFGVLRSMASTFGRLPAKERTWVGAGFLRRPQALDEPAPGEQIL